MCLACECNRINSIQCCSEVHDCATAYRLFTLYFCGQYFDQGRSDGGYIGIYTPKISLPYKFLCGYWLFFDIVPVCALAKLAKLKFIPPQMKFLAMPLILIQMGLAAGESAVVG